MRVLFVFLKSMIRLMQIDAEFRKLFDQLSSETAIDKYINFDIEFVTSLPTIDQLTIEWRKETSNKSIAEGKETSDAAEEVINPKRSHRMSSLVVSDLRSETKSSRFESVPMCRSQLSVGIAGLMSKCLRSG